MVDCSELAAVLLQGTALTWEALVRRAGVGPGIVPVHGRVGAASDGHGGTAHSPRDAVPPDIPGHADELHIKRSLCSKWLQEQWAPLRDSVVACCRSLERPAALLLTGGHAACGMVEVYTRPACAKQ